jgi:hypothetical protein
MEDHFQFSDEVFENQFEKCLLDPELFSHEAHLRLAWIHIRKSGFEQALKNVREQLKNFTRHVGAEDKYHETVTVAAVKAVYHFMLKSEKEDFPSFIKENIRLKTHFKELLAQHYQEDIFQSKRARKEYVEPDLLAFD